MGHSWFIHPKFKPLVVCKDCGVVRRRDGRNAPCPGKVRVALRENRVAEGDISQPRASTTKEQERA